MDDFENKLVGALSDVASRTDVGHAPLAEIKTPAPRRGWVRPLVAAAAVLAVVGAGFAVAPLVGGKDDADADLVVAAPGKRLAGLGSVLVEVPGDWGTRSANGTDRGAGCNDDQPQESTVEYQRSTVPAIPASEMEGPPGIMTPCLAIALPGDYRRDDVEVVQFSSSAPAGGDGKLRTGFLPGELAGVPADILPAVCDRKDLSDSVYCTASARFPAANGGQDVWVITEAWTAERATEMLSWVRIASDQVGVPAPASTSLEAYLRDLEALGLDAKVTEQALPQGQLPSFEPNPEPTTVLVPGDEVTVTVRGIDLPDSTPDDAPPPGTRQIGMGDLMMDVPAEWDSGMVKCDVPIANTWLVGMPQSRGCFSAVQRPDDVEVVRWQRVEAFADFLGEPVRSEEFLGVETTRWETECGPYNDAGPEVCTAQVWFDGDDSKALVTVEAPTQERADELIATLRRSDTLVGLPPAPENPDGFTTPAGTQEYLDLLDDLGVAAVAVDEDASWRDAEDVLVKVAFTVAGRRVAGGEMADPTQVSADVTIRNADDDAPPEQRNPSIPGG